VAEKFYGMKYDIVLKKLFTAEGFDDILKDFIGSVLDYDPQYLQIAVENPSFVCNSITDKQSILDVKTEIKIGSKIERIDIEIQVQNFNTMKRRIVYYNAKMLTEQINSGDYRYNIKNCISIIICVEHNLICQDDKYFHSFLLYDPDNNVTYDDVIQIHTLEILKLPKNNDGKRIWEWLNLIKADKELEVYKAAGDDAVLKKAAEEIVNMNRSDYERAEFAEREKSLMDARAIRNNEQQKIYIKGKKEGKIEVAKQLLNMGLSIEQVLQGTGLSTDEINKIKRTTDI
jgi:predicted transposase/invertase (TIGR01784 family)